MAKSNRGKIFLLLALLFHQLSAQENCSTTNPFQQELNQSQEQGPNQCTVVSIGSGFLSKLLTRDFKMEWYAKYKKCTSNKTKKFNGHLNECNFYDLTDGTIMINQEDGHLVRVSQKDLIATFLLMAGALEPFLLAVTTKLVKRGNICITVGANIGTVELAIARVIGNEGKVYAIEASPSAMELLEFNVRQNNYDNIITANMAIMDKNEKVFFSDSVHSTLGGKISSQATNVTIQGVTLDSFVNQMGIVRPVDFLRFDIEGSECKAITGALKTIDKSPNVIIAFEWQSELLLRYSSPKELSQCIDNLTKRNFSFWAFNKPFLDNVKEEADENSLRRMHPELIYEYDVMEFVAVRENQIDIILAGLYDKTGFSYDDFWFTTNNWNDAISTIEQRGFNTADSNGEHLLDKIIKCGSKLGSVTCNENVIGIIEELHKAGEICSYEVHSHYSQLDQMSNGLGKQLYDRFCISEQDE